jgi:archaemetzincin
MSRKTTIPAILLVLAALSWFGYRYLDAEAPSPEMPTDFGPEPIVLDPETEDPDFPRKGKPRPGDWLWYYDEPGQTVAEYKRECANRRTDVRKVIVIQPIGGIADRFPDELEAVREFLSIYYDCKTEIAKPIEMPPGAWDASRNQALAERILVDLRNHLEGRMIAMLGFCEEDLYSGDMNFVFGLGNLSQRVGVYSLARYHMGAKNNNALFLERALKVAAHECGHMFSLRHCICHECCLNGSNSLQETDFEPIFLCPECLVKIRWNLGLDLYQRYLKMAVFFDRHGLTDNAAFARRQAAKFPGHED